MSTEVGVAVMRIGNFPVRLLWVIGHVARTGAVWWRQSRRHAIATELTKCLAQCSPPQPRRRIIRLNYLTIIAETSILDVGFDATKETIITEDTIVLGDFHN